MLQISSIRLPITSSKEDAVEAAKKRLHLRQNQIETAQVSKVSIDARHKKAELVYTVSIQLKDKSAEPASAASAPFVSYKEQKPFHLKQGEMPLHTRPVVCGFGPAGMFCALVLAKYGFQPIVLERGPQIEKRKQEVEKFFATGKLNTEANVQFGEGGAGTFSDGKLTTRIGDVRQGYVMQLFLENGAPEEIAYQQHPHVGTDKLEKVIISIRNEIIRLGGEIYFETKLNHIKHLNQKIKGIETTKESFKTDLLVLATGHSARDVFSYLNTEKIEMVSKPFSVGYRIEHLQSEIDKSLFHEAAGHPALGKGEYHLSEKVNGRGVYTFCMCPGGVVVPAASEEEGVVTNGMSNYARDGLNANAAVVVSLLPEDFQNDPMQAINFQRKLEQNAYTAGGGYYKAPAETVDSFLYNKGNLNIKSVTPSYGRSVTPFPLSALLPQELSNAIQTALPIFNRKINGFTAEDSVLTGLETRTSSPVRILRGDNLQSQSISGLYPCGEGAGYAGGIVSAAVDGVRVAEEIIQTYTAQYE